MVTDVTSIKFHCIAHFDSDGELVCFCPYEESLKPNRCVCREKYDCPEVLMDITVLPNSKPSDQADTVSSAFKKVDRELKNTASEIRRSAALDIKSIKKGLSRLEKDMKRIPIK